MKKSAVFFLLLLYPLLACVAQDSLYVRSVIKELTSEKMWGRGYTKSGMRKAANYIALQFKSFGLQPMDGKDYEQRFTFAVNTFPGEMNLSVNDRKLIPGKDYIVAPASTGVIASSNLEQRDSVTFLAAKDRIVVLLANKLTWSVATEVNDHTEILVQQSSLQETPKSLKVNIKNLFIPEFEASNICGFVKGTTKPDSMLLITAHYDHLGGMGNETYFPGANDNASGVAFLLSLAKYYAKNPQTYSIGFICFAGEEAGLLGAKRFTMQPLIPLQHIRFLFNVDMVGTGEKGATVVNATIHPNEFAKLTTINNNYHYLPQINARGKAANSDHHPFTEKGVPAFFLYTQGGISAYHDVFDQATTLPLTVYNNLFKLLVAFNTALMSSN